MVENNQRPTSWQLSKASAIGSFISNLVYKKTTAAANCLTIMLAQMCFSIVL